MQKVQTKSSSFSHFGTSQGPGIGFTPSGVVLTVVGLHHLKATLNSRVNGDTSG